MAGREDNVYMAKLAEQAERYEGTPLFSKGGQSPHCLFAVFSICNHDEFPFFSLWAPALMPGELLGARRPCFSIIVLE